ncbi:MAG: hypothetical protein K2M60_08930 [Lachnospiraceae bacterium]|nr:hypothetical protein [Lachnospiraceae bacterium]
MKEVWNVDTTIRIWYSGCCSVIRKDCWNYITHLTVRENINPGYNGKLMETCRTLDEYCRYVESVRKHAEVMAIEDAVECAVKECIKENILADFLKGQRVEVVAMSIFEYDEETELKKYFKNLQKDEKELYNLTGH